MFVPYHNTHSRQKIRHQKIKFTHSKCWEHSNQNPHRSPLISCNNSPVSTLELLDRYKISMDCQPALEVEELRVSRYTSEDLLKLDVELLLLEGLYIR